MGEDISKDICMHRDNSPGDRIYVNNLKVFCTIGTKAEEREKKQEITINVVLDTDLRRACDSDDIEDTVNYGTVCSRLTAKAETSAYFLIEALAQHLAECCLNFSGVSGVRVRIDKPGAIKNADSAAVEIYRIAHE